LIMAQQGRDAVLDRLARLHPKVIDLSLDRMWRLLDRLCNPQKHLPPVIHVAGTNGKGSVIAYLQAMLEAAGQRVHVYTSPHLVRFAERIRLAGRIIDEDRLYALLEDCERRNRSEPVTFFEVTTAAAFLAFAETPADFLLLETGLGGRLDATNVVDRPLMTILTPVSMDHMGFLGNSLTLIAAEKAAIQKNGVVSVTGSQKPEALRVIEEAATAAGAPLLRHGRDWTLAERPGGLRFDAYSHRLPLAAPSLDLPFPALPGRHQHENAGIATAAALALRGLGMALDDAAITSGLGKAVWPARLQRLRDHAVNRLLGADWDVWLDGGHNAAAGQALADMAAGWSDRPLYLVFGMLNTKEIRDFLRPLAPHVTVARALPVPGSDNGLPPEAAARAARDCGMDCRAAAGLADAVSGLPPGPGRLLICGSLYLAGAVLAAA